MSRATLVLACLALTLSTTSVAQTWDESTDGGGDAGSLRGSAQIITTGSLSTVSGTISSNDKDLYRIIVTTGSAFSADVTADFNAIVFLVDEDGEAVYLNDDRSGADNQPLLPAGHTHSPTGSGQVYYLGVTGFGDHPEGFLGDQIFTYTGSGDLTDVHGPSGLATTLLGYNGGFTNPSGSYSIALTSAEGDPSLPVELVNFQAKHNDGDVYLSWKTLSEDDNLGFEVEVMDPQATTYRTLAFVNASGSATEAQDYNYTASNMEVGTHVFRLKQVDTDGSFVYSQTVEVTVELPDSFVMNPVYPNPFNPQASFDFAVREQQIVRASLYNMLGQEVAQLFNDVVASSEVKTVSIDGSNLPSGIYVVRLAGESFESSRTVSLLK